MLAAATSEALLGWLRQSGAYIGPIDIRTSQCGDGAGAFLTRPVPDGEPLFAVPRTACVSTDNAEMDPDCGKHFAALRQHGGDGGAGVALAGFVAKSWLCSGSAGLYGSYLSSLPWAASPNQDHVIWWTDEEVEQLLGGSAALKAALEMRDGVTATSKLLRPLLASSLPPGSRRTAAARAACDDSIDQALRGAFVSVLSRAFESDAELFPGRAGCRELVPLLDMLQHSEHPSITHGTEFSAESDEELVVARSIGARPAGHELVIRYHHDLDAAEFFAQFGFAPQPDAEAQQGLEGKDCSMRTLLRDGTVNAVELFGPAGDTSS